MSCDPLGFLLQSSSFGLKQHLTVSCECQKNHTIFLSQQERQLFIHHFIHER